GGGIWNWLDPITPIKALWEISRNRSDIKLLFIGIKHPDPKLPQMKKCLEAIKLSQELDLYEKNIFFNEWTAYDTRQSLLLESDIGLSIHQERIETEFSYRTRVMDYIWAGLPVITTTGDSIAKMVKEENIGEVVKYEDTHQLARVIESMLENRSLQDIYKKNLKKIRSRFYWENVSEPLVNYCTNAHYAVDKAKTSELIDIQNSRISRIINKYFEGMANVLVITRNRSKDAEILTNGAVGKAFYVELGKELEKVSVSGEKEDTVGQLKLKITQRTKFDGIILNNAFSSMKPRFFYDLVNVLSMKIKKGGMFFFSVPENRGLLERLGEGKNISKSDIRIDDFTVEFILKNGDFEVLDKGIWDKVESAQELTGETDFGEVYGKNELFELFEINPDQQDFEKLKLLSRFDILESEEFASDRSVRGRLRKYMYAISSIYFENLRKSYNESIKSINNNIQIQINNEINQLNRKNRERMVLIYYNIFKSLYNEIKGLGYDISSLKCLLEDIIAEKKMKQSVDIDQQIEVLLRDLESIDRMMGLSISFKYFVARKK
ncbi:MAG: glycosyltransferase, partial [Actinobacteria bacterium]|nr:glycosyltransferase [Actinomycetota bacterium]